MASECRATQSISFGAMGEVNHAWLCTQCLTQKCQSLTSTHIGHYVVPGHITSSLLAIVGFVCSCAVVSCCCCVTGVAVARWTMAIMTTCDAPMLNPTPKTTGPLNHPPTSVPPEQPDCAPPVTTTSPLGRMVASPPTRGTNMSSCVCRKGNSAFCVCIQEVGAIVFFFHFRLNLSLGPQLTPEEASNGGATSIEFAAQGSHIRLARIRKCLDLWLCQG
jgi:hypothetical protein